MLGSRQGHVDPALVSEKSHPSFLVGTDSRYNNYIFFLALKGVDRVYHHILFQVHQLALCLKVLMTVSEDSPALGLIWGDDSYRNLS